MMMMMLKLVSCGRPSKMFYDHIWGPIQKLVVFCFLKSISKSASVFSQLSRQVQNIAINDGNNKPVCLICSSLAKRLLFMMQKLSVKKTQYIFERDLTDYFSGLWSTSTGPAADYKRGRCFLASHWPMCHVCFSTCVFDYVWHKTVLFAHLFSIFECDL